MKKGWRFESRISTTGFIEERWPQAEPEASTYPGTRSPLRLRPRVSAAVTASLHSETGWAATPIGNRGTGRQNRAAGCGRDPQSDLRGGLRWFLVWFSAGPGRSAYGAPNLSRFPLLLPIPGQVRHDVF